MTSLKFVIYILSFFGLVFKTMFCRAHPIVSRNLLHSSHKKLQSHWEVHLTREQITLALEP
jgi:hypothetical protein